MQEELTHTVRKWTRRVCLDPRGRTDPTRAVPGQVVARVRRELLADGDFAQDVLTDVYDDFVAACAAGQVDPEHVTGWLVIATRRRIGRVARTRTRKAFDIIEPSVAHPDPVVDFVVETVTPEDIAARREEAQRLDAILASLTDSDRELLVAKCKGSYADLAKRRGTVPGNLRRQACELCARLRRQVADSVVSDAA